MCASFAPNNDSAPGKLVFNRTITLKDTWAKEAQKAWRSGASADRRKLKQEF